MSQFTRASCSSCPSHTSHNQGCISQPPWSSLFLPLMQPVPPSVSILSSLSSQAAVWPAGCSTGSTCSCGSPVCLTCLWAKTITHIEREREREGKGLGVRRRSLTSSLWRCLSCREHMRKSSVSCFGLHLKRFKGLTPGSFHLLTHSAGSPAHAPVSSYVRRYNVNDVTRVPVALRPYLWPSADEIADSTEWSEVLGKKVS